jgi:hypothetical protein
MWTNLTGGNNVVNFALELAATLSGDIARLYYVQAENPIAEKCVRFSAENGYWVELPVMPLALSERSRAVLEILQGARAMRAEELRGRALNHSAFWSLAQNIDSDVFKEMYLKPLWKQGLVAEADKDYVIGPQWELIRPYEEILQQARQANLTIEQLAQREAWIDQEELALD